MTKKNSALLANYRSAHMTELYQAYSRPSYNKVKALAACREKQHIAGGYDGRICSASCHFFTYAFRYKDANNNERLHYMTGRNNYDFAIE